MSRKPKIIPPIKGSFNDILTSIGNSGKNANRKTLAEKVSKKRKIGNSSDLKKLPKSQQNTSSQAKNPPTP